MTKSIMIDLNDPRSGKIAEVMGNKSCKNILDLLSDKELSVGDIAKELKMPVNTAMYNVEKLADAGLIEKANWIWSIKGKRIEKYKISNKRIVISPRKLTRGIVPALIFGGIATYFVSMINRNEFLSNNLSGGFESSKMFANQGGAGGAELMADQVINSPIRDIYNSGGIMNIPAWEWFALGVLVAILFYLVYDLINERRNK